MLEVAARTPVLKGFIAKFYGERPAPGFFQMDSGEWSKLECFRGVKQDDAMGPALFFLPLRPVLMRVREEHESQGVQAYAYFDDITISAHEISLRTMGMVIPQARVNGERHTPRPG